MRSSLLTPARRRALIAHINRHGIVYGDFILAGGARTGWKIDMEKAAAADRDNVIGSALLQAWHEFPQPAIAGVASGGTAVANQMIEYALAQQLKLFGCSVGKGDAGIEGDFTAGRPMLLIEDVVTTGISVERALRKIESAGGAVDAILAIVDREPGTPKQFARRHLPYRYLAGVDELKTP